VKVLLVLILGIVIGAAAYWFLSSSDKDAELRSAGEHVGTAVKTTREAVQEKLRVLDLRPEDIKEELSRTGQIVRRKTREAGQAIVDATADARITAAIKGKLVTDRTLSALSISVNTTEGVVTLSGAVSTPEDISKAMLLAMDTEGVREVISVLQVKTAAAKK